MNSISSFQELSIYRNDLIKLCTREGDGESDLVNILTSSGALILVKKSRKKLNFGSVDLEMCILEISCTSNVSKWSSVSVESHNEDDILVFLKQRILPGEKSAIRSPPETTLHCCQLFRAIQCGYNLLTAPPWIQSPNNFSSMTPWVGYLPWSPSVPRGERNLLRLVFHCLSFS